MKRIFLLLVVMAFAAVGANAQKIGYINSETIYKAIPEYTQAQSKLDAIAKGYQTEIENKYKYIESLYNKYQEDKERFSAAQRKSKEQQIISLENEAKELQKRYFGEDGVMRKESEALIAPIKEKVDAAIKKLAETGNFIIIFDTAIMQGVTYSAPNADLSKQVLSILGY